MQRRTLFLLSLLVLIPALALAALYLLVSPEKLRPVLEAQLSQALRRPVKVGEMSFSVVPISLRAKAIEIAEDPAFAKGSFATAETLEVQPQILPLLSGRVVVDSIALESPRIELRKNSSQRWNWESLGDRGGSNESKLSLGRLEIRNATVGMTDASGERSEYRRLGLELRDYAPAKPFRLKVSAQTSDGVEIGAGGSVEVSSAKTSLRAFELHFAGLKGTLGGEVSGSNLALKLDIPSSPLAEAAPLFLPKDTSAKGQVSAKVEVSGSTAAPRLQGRVAIEGFEVSGGQIKQAVRTKNLVLELTPERVSLLPADIESGSTRIQAYGVVSQYAAKPTLEATLVAPNAQIEELLAIARAYGAGGAETGTARGRARLQVRAHGPLNGTLNFAGNGTIEDAEFTAPNLTKPLRVGHADIRFAEDSVALENVAASIGSTKASGSLKVANFRSPRAEFALKADRLSLAELRSWTKESKSEAKPGRLTAQGSVEIGHLDLENLVLERLTAQCNYRDGHLTLNPLRASMYGGTHVGNMDIDMRTTPPVFQLQSRLDRIESSGLLAAVTPMKGIVSGPLSADLDLKVSPADPVAMARSLNGNLKLHFDQGRIASFNLTNELAAVAKFLGFNASAERFTQFLAINGDLAISNGVGRTENLKMDLANMTATLTGGMNFADQTLDMKLLSILDRKFSEQVGGNKIGGFMSAALANAQGNLLIPATIKGTFQKPVMAPDASAMAKLKLQSFSPKDPKQVMDQVEGVLGIFRKKKQ